MSSMPVQESKNKDSEINHSRAKEEIESKVIEGMMEETEDRAMANLTDPIKGKTMVSEEASITTARTINQITTKEKGEEGRTNTMTNKKTMEEEVRRRLNLVTKELTRSQSTTILTTECSNDLDDLL